MIDIKIGSSHNSSELYMYKNKIFAHLPSPQSKFMYDMTKDMLVFLSDCVNHSQIVNLKIETNFTQQNIK